MTTKVLFLDDDKIRHELFILNNNKPGVEIQQCWTATSAIKCLMDMPKFDVIFLDHDLAESHYNGKGYEKAGTGMDVVDYLCTVEEDKRPDTVIIHSWNIGRAIEMEKRLLSVGFKSYKCFRVPFDGKSII